MSKKEPEPETPSTPRTLEYNFCEVARGGCGSRAVVLEQGDKRCLTCGILHETAEPPGPKERKTPKPRSRPRPTDGEHAKLDGHALDNMIASAKERTDEARREANKEKVIKTLERLAKKNEAKAIKVDFSFDDF